MRQLSGRFSPYLAMFRMRFIARIQYRAAAWAGIATQFFFGFVLVMIYVAFYRASPAAQPMALPQLVSYLWLQQAFLAIIAAYSADGELFELITKGNIAYEMCRPYNLFCIWYVRLIANRVADAALRCLPIITVALLLPQPYRLSFPAGPVAFGLFMLSLAFGLLVMVAVSMFAYIWTFKTLAPAGPRAIISAVSEFFMGSVIPIPLMPDAWQRVMDFLPFRYIQDLPFRIYSGHIAGVDALLQMCVQLVWAAALFGAGMLCFDRALRKVVVQGG